MAERRCAAPIPDEALADALAQVKDALREAIGEDFRLILYGSRARGDAEPDSDVDLMVILPDDRADSETEGKLRDTVYDFSLRTDYLFSVVVVSESYAREWSGFKVFGAVEREGITI